MVRMIISTTSVILILFCLPLQLPMYFSRSGADRIVEDRMDMFKKIKAGSKGGRPGQWSARKAQMLASAYKKAGGGYRN